MITPNLDFRSLYDHFDVPVTEFDCGQFCAVHNPNGKPFCCDICFSVPAAYLQEWDYLSKSTDLWHLWQGCECISEPVDPKSIKLDTPGHMCLLACNGPDQCQRDYRTMSCRQFPFFPYITADDRFIGLTYNWDFESTCWVISNLDLVTQAFRKEFIETYDNLLSDWPDEYDSYYFLSDDMRAHFLSKHRRIPILHRNGGYYLLSPNTDRLYRVAPSQFKRFEPYR